jgi:DNA-binding FadR family transcriptional regulator
MDRLPMTTFKPLAPARLYRIIADQIAARIRSGEFACGDRLPSERELAERMGVSRPSIREALIALEIQGFVDVRVGTGVFVQQARANGATADAGTSDGNDIGPFDLLEARLLVEPECVALTAQQASAQQIDAIEDAHRAMSLSASPSRHDRAFHDAIGAGCGNAALAAMVSCVWDLCESSAVYRRLDAHFVNAQVWQTAHQEHARIVAAVRARDPIRARHAMRNHIESILARLREDFGTSLDIQPS